MDQNNSYNYSNNNIYANDNSQECGYNSNQGNGP